ncbi:hypothetical protein FKM82_010014 [Ascaphus truei]
MNSLIEVVGLFFRDKIHSEQGITRGKNRNLQYDEVIFSKYTCRGGCGTADKAEEGVLIRVYTRYFVVDALPVFTLPIADPLLSQPHDSFLVSCI